MIIILYTSSIGLSQDLAPKETIDHLVSLLHGVEWEYTAGKKEEIDKVLNNLSVYQEYLNVYLNAPFMDQSDEEALRKAQNAVYLLANAKGESGRKLLQEKYQEFDARVEAAHDSLKQFHQEDRASRAAISLRKEANIEISLQRYILENFRKAADAQLQEKVLADFRELDFSSQIVALRYLTEVKAADTSLETKKYEELSEIYQDSTQFLYQSELLKKALERQ